MADMLWTDPPYGVGYVGKTAAALTIEGDHEGIGPLLDAAFACADSALSPGAAVYLARPPGALGVVFLQAFVERWHLHEELQWVKDSMVLGHSDYHLRHETIVYGWTGGGGRATWHGDRSQTSVFEIPRPKRSETHPTMKPVELVVRAIENSSIAGALVLDPFLGSGSTMIAAEQAGRRCVGMDVDPVYVDVAVARWEDFTGQKAVRG